MTEAQEGQITELLRRLANGDRQAEEELLPLLYRDLRSLAARYMAGERPDHTLQPTALVNEAYLRLTGERIAWNGREHFIALIARKMRLVLIDHAKVRAAAKRGGGVVKIALGGSWEPGTDESWSDLLALHQALERLAEKDPRQAQVVELRFFTGLEINEIAEILQISTRTVKRDWESAQAWLYNQLQPVPVVFASSDKAGS
jgi:RNA polymerase sigma-70 factor (ECF subfamily)